MSDQIILSFTREEAETLLAGLAFETGHYGETPEPPTPAMTAEAKLNKSLETA